MGWEMIYFFVCSCLYHSLSYISNNEKLYNENGFALRHVLNKYISDNLTKEIWTVPEVGETLHSGEVTACDETYANYRFFKSFTDLRRSPYFLREIIAYVFV